MTDPLPIALTHAQRNMLETLAQLPNHWWSTDDKSEIKAFDDLVTLRLARCKGNMYIISQYGIAELAAIRGE